MQIHILYIHQLRTATRLNLFITHLRHSVEILDLSSAQWTLDTHMCQNLLAAATIFSMSTHRNPRCAAIGIVGHLCRWVCRRWVYAGHVYVSRTPAKKANNCCLELLEKFSVQLKHTFNGLNWRHSFMIAKHLNQCDEGAILQILSDI